MQRISVEKCLHITNGSPKVLNYGATMEKVMTKGKRWIAGSLFFAHTVP
ncbi:hypothetical protein [Planococcus shixiaomingii]|nr:hypothetical protein [Planococcus sp. N028]